jgi:hypothetical protein
MPILLWVVFPFAVWSAYMDQTLSTTTAERHAKRIPRLNARTRSRRIALIAMSASFQCGCAGAPIKALSAT